MITFTSSSTVKNFAEALGGNISIPASVLLVCIGPVTAQTCRESLREPDRIASDYTIEGLIATLTVET
jgi:uroporphyrinogen III methyltransferase/synthase